MNSLNYEQESQKEHVEIGKVYYQDTQKDQLFIATLELFGNGYDITVYENDEPQYVNRSVVREISFEFLQYTDDGELVIVRVNSELFVMSEQQFELVKTYYDLLQSDSNAVNTFKLIKNTIDSKNNKSAGYYFEEDDELFYVYDEILSDPSNIRLRIKLAYHLMNEIQYFNKIETLGDLVKYVTLCKENLNEISNIKVGKDKRLFFTKALAISQLGCVYSLEGELDQAVKLWYKAIDIVLESNIREYYDIKRFIGVNALNIKCILNYLNEVNSLEKISIKYNQYIHNFCANWIDSSQKILEMKTPGTDEYNYAKERLDIIMKLESTLEYISMIEFYDEDYESIYSPGVTPEFDDFSFTYIRLKNIKEDLEIGVYKPIFEKDYQVINKQKMRISAYI